MCITCIAIYAYTKSQSREREKKKNVKMQSIETRCDIQRLCGTIALVARAAV